VIIITVYSKKGLEICLKFKNKMKIIIIGGLSAGPSAAAKARREDENAEIILFEKGSNISYATCGMPYAFSGIIENREDLIVVKPDLLKNRFNIDVKLNEEILNIDTSNKIVYSNKGDYTYDKLIMATGASSIVPPIKNINIATNWSTCRSMPDFDKIMEEGLATNSKNITIIGGGLIGIEVAENLKLAGKNVTLIEGAKEVLSMWQSKFGVIAEKILIDNGINIITSSIVSEFDLNENGKIKNVIIKGKEPIETDFVIVSAGIKPNTDLLLNRGAKHIKNGALIVNEYLETSIKDVYAAGDNVAIKNLQTNEYGYFPLGTHSNKAGRAAGANAVGSETIFKGAYNTAIVQVFDYTFARTGMNAKFLKQQNIPFKKVLTIVGATPGYYPNKKEIVSEIYFNPTTKEIYGAEVVGEVGVDKRIDVLSTAIYAKLKISDLAQLDLAYAPPYSPAKDSLVVASFVSENIVNEKCPQVSVEDLDVFMNETDPSNYLLIDIRTQKEYEAGTLANAINIPIDEIRSQINFIKNEEKPVILICRSGLRAYIAQLILVQNNIKEVANVAGGIKLWQLYNKTVIKPKEMFA